MRGNPEEPPADLLGGRLLEYAVLADRVPYSGHSYLYVDGKELGPVPRLALSQLAEAEVLLAHCDDGWEVLGVAGYPSVVQAKKRAERIYPGVSACWVAAEGASG